MGLDTSHGAFNGSYMAFDLLRDAICAACGDGSYPPHSQDFMIQYFTEHAEDPDPELVLGRRRLQQGITSRIVRAAVSFRLRRRNRSRHMREDRG